ncbi:trigger factor [Thermodesulfobacteriota bacterium]
MQVTVEELSSVKKKLHIEVPKDDVIRELDKAYAYLKQNAKIRGFRPGKAPRSVLERLYRKDVHADVLSKLIQESFVDAIKETELKMVGDPHIDPPDLNDKESYKYEATIEVDPEIEDINYKGLKFKKTLYQVSDTEIENQLGALQKNMAQHQPIVEDRSAQKEDVALVDFEGFKDGKPFEETQKTENFAVKIGDGKVLPDFDEKLIGMKPGEDREIQVKFPEDYFNKKLAGIEITFQVKLKEIRKEVLPELDNEFAKQLGSYETVEELKDGIRKNLRQGYDKRQEQELNEQIFQALIEQQPFEVPQTLINSELDAIYDELEQSFAYQNKSAEDTGFSREYVSERYHDTAQKQVRRYLILKKMIEQEDLSISDENLEEGFQEMADSVGHPLDEIKGYYEENKEKLVYFKHTLLEKQAIKLILDNSQIEEVEQESSQQSENSEN